MEIVLDPLSQILSGLQAVPGGIRASVGDDWRQGRTLYGGLSAALCVEAAIRSLPDLPPLRSAQFAFAGPASGDVSVQASVLRRGKSTVFASVVLTGDAGPALQALLCFAAHRPSRLEHWGVTPPAAPPPDGCPDFFDSPLAPDFSQHFEARRAGGAQLVSGSAEPELLMWIRHRDRQVARDATALVALGDAAPPAAMTMFTGRAPISTMTWSLDMLADPRPDLPDEWLLMRSVGQTASGGYATQAMFLWDSEGRPLMTGSQCVAVFT